MLIARVLQGLAIAITTPAALSLLVTWTEDNPTGVDRSVFDGIQATARADRYAWFTQFYRDFYNLDENLGTRISDEVVRTSFAVAAGAGAKASWAVVPSWLTDFRADVAKVAESGVPALIVHGTADRILPVEATGREFAKQLPNARYVEIDAAPHGSCGHTATRSPTRCCRSSPTDQRAGRAASPGAPAPPTWTRRPGLGLPK